MPVRLRLTLLFASLMLGVAMHAVPAAAQGAREYNYSGPYVGIGAGWISGTFEDEAEGVLRDISGGQQIDLSIDDSWSLNALAGYRVFSFLAAEVQYEYVGEYEISAVDNTPGPTGGLTGSADLSAHVITLNLKLIAPFWRLQPYVLVGVGYASYASNLSSEVENNTGLTSVDIFDDFDSFAGRIGLGFDYYLTKHVVLNAGFSAVLTAKELSTSLDPSQDLGDLHYLSVGAGVQYRF